MRPQPGAVSFKKPMHLRSIKRISRRAAARPEREHSRFETAPTHVQFEARGRALVRRRRHAARLPSRERPRRLSQPLGPHAEVAGRARRRPPAVRRLRPQAARRAGHVHHQDGGVANTNIIFHAGRLLALRKALHAHRDGARHPRTDWLLPTTRAPSPTTPPIPRSIPIYRRDGVLRLSTPRDR